MKKWRVKNFLKRLVAVILISAMFIGHARPVFGFDRSNYTYSFDAWGVDIPSPDAYRVTAYILGEHLGIGNFVSPQDIHVIDNLVYLVDTGNDRIVILQFNEEDGSHDVYDVIEYALMDGTPTRFNGPRGIFVADWGEIWLADTQNHRVLPMDSEWNVIREITHPEGSMLDPGLHFLPNKLGVDPSGTLFVQATHVNRGLMEFDVDGTFSGYMGATPVVISPVDQFWRMIATQAQRARMDLHVPTEFNNVTIDPDGFIFVTNSSQLDAVDPIRRLNAMGDDILIRNGWFEPIGDLWWATTGMITGPSQFIDVTVLPNETYVAFDRTRGRLFAYDPQGNLLYVFGGRGNREGTFEMPVALGSMGFALYALCSHSAALTRFDLTEYGLLINTALSLYRQGQYEASAEVWQEVLRMNGLFGQAYIGIAMALLRQGYYREAMRYFRLQYDFRGYGRAFGFYRRQWIEDHFWIFALALGVLIIVPPTVKLALRIRRDVLAS